MTIESLLNKLRADREKIDAMITMLEPYIHTEKTAQKILTHLKGRKKPHWTQTPAGRRLLSRRQKRVWAEKRKEAA